MYETAKQKIALVGIVGTIATMYGYVAIEMYNATHDKTLITQHIVNGITQTSEHIYNALFI